MRVKIHGAGSIGNHLAHASRRLGWDVLVCDIDPAALDRMRKDIYPGRYGVWDESITLVTSDKAPQGGFDLVCVGTPPDSHIALGRSAVTEGTRALLLEKPLCPPNLVGAAELEAEAARANVRAFVGYDHVVGRAAQEAEALVRSGAVGRIETIDVEFREHWEGIFKAHPWLSGPADTYLGFWQRGGGASGEHSHALNLWQHFAHVAGAGRVAQLSAQVTYAEAGAARYDSACQFTLRTESGLPGRVIQDVLTRPARKRAVLQGTDGVIEWVNGHSPEGDAVIVYRPGGAAAETRLFPKKRPDDFIVELTHIAASLKSGDASPISLSRGLDTAVCVAAAHACEREGKRVTLDWSRGPRPEAIR